jgi:hypothetical protein
LENLKKGKIMGTISDVLGKLQDIVKELSTLDASGPTHFGPALLVSSTPTPTPFGPLGPYTLVFQPVAGGPNLTLVLSSVPSVLKVGPMPYTFDYVQGAPVDTISNVAVAGLAYGPALLIAVSSAPAPFTLTFVSLSGGPGLTLKLASVPAGMTAGVTQSYTFDYILASSSGQQYDQIVDGTIVTNTL